MKKIHVTSALCMAIMALASSCSQDLDQAVNSPKTYTATVENTGATRSYNAGNGAFVWSNGDDACAWTGSKFETLKFKSGAGTAVATYEDVTSILKDVAVFPVSAAKSYADGTLTVNYPTTRAQSAKADDPMVATFGEGASTLNFMHVGGVIAFKIQMPAGADNFVVTTDKAISGDFSVDLTGAAPQVATTDEGVKSVKFTFNKTTASGIMYFYLPVPTGTYNSIKIAAMSGNTELKSITNTTANTIDRCDWVSFELSLSTITGVIETPITGVDALNNYINETSAEDKAKTNLTVDLNGGELTNTVTDTEKSNKKYAITANSVTISNGTVDASGLNITASSGVTLKDVKVTGAFPQKKCGNSRININTPGKVVIDGVDFTGTTDGYNAIEINLNSNPISRDITVKNCKFGSKLTNNSILIFGLPDGSVVNIENCEFELSNTSNPLRISNKFNANSFTINIKDCNYKYADTSYEGGEYTGFILFQDYTSASAEIANATKQFSGLKINCNNVTYDGAKITDIGIGTKKTNTQFAYVYYNKVGVISDKSHYPIFTFQ